MSDYTQYGLTLSGFVIPSVADIRNDISGALRTAFGASLPLGDDTLLGFWVGIVAERLSLLWQLAQQSWAALDPDAATGFALEALSLLTGTFRLAAASSTVVETLCGVDGTLVSNGAQVNTASTSQAFATVADAIIAALPTWAVATAYTAGQRVTANGQCYQATVAGVSAGTGTGPSITAFGTTTDGGVTWAWIGTGAAAVDVAMAAVNTGPTVAVAGDITAITNTQSGWNTAVNLLDAAKGSDVQSDQGLRLARNAELSADGSTTPDAIRAALLKLDGVTNAIVFFNNTESTIDDLPPHSVKALVQGGADQDIGNFLWRMGVAAGITSVGTVPVTVIDSEGNPQIMYFSRPTPRLIYTRTALTFDPKTYAGDAAVQLAIAQAGTARAVGVDAVARAVNASVFGVAGVIDADTLIYTDVIAPPSTWAPSTTYVATVGARSVVLADGGRAYICTVGGTSGTSGPSGVGSTIADGSCVWAFLESTIAVDSSSLALYDTTRIAVTSAAGTL